MISRAGVQKWANLGKNLGRPASPRPAGLASLKTRPRLQTSGNVTCSRGSELRVRPWFDWMDQKACTKNKRATTQYQLRSRAVIHHRGKSPECRGNVSTTEGRVGPEGGRPAYNLKCSGNTTTTDLLKQSRTSVKRRWLDGRNPWPAGLGEAGRPHFAMSHALASHGRQAH